MNPQIPRIPRTKPTDETAALSGFFRGMRRCDGDICGDPAEAVQSDGIRGLERRHPWAWKRFSSTCQSTGLARNNQKIRRKMGNGLDCRLSYSWVTHTSVMRIAATFGSLSVSPQEVNVPQARTVGPLGGQDNRAK